MSFVAAVSICLVGAGKYLTDTMMYNCVLAYKASVYVVSICSISGLDVEGIAV